MPPLLARALRFVPAAMLTALVAADGRAPAPAAGDAVAASIRSSPAALVAGGRRVAHAQHAEDAGGGHGRAVAAAVAAGWRLSRGCDSSYHSGCTRRGDPHALRRHRHLRRHPRPDARGQRGDRAGAAAAGQGRARHRQDAAGRGGRARARPAAAAVAHQVDDQGAAGPLRVRRRVAAARLAAGRRARRRHRATTSSAACCGRRSRRRRPRSC